MLSTEPETLEKNEENTQICKKVLIILPHYNFRDKEYGWLKERLNEAGIVGEVASTHLSEAQGRFGMIVMPDVLIGYVEATDYDAYIFIGEEAASEFFGNTDIRRIVDKGAGLGKILAAIGAAVPILGYTGHLVGRKVTSVESEKMRLEEMGAYFTGKIVEHDGNIITANGPYGIREFSDHIVKVLSESKATTGSRRYLR